MIKIAGVDAYHAGQDYQASKSVVLLFTDVFGLKLNNFRPMADRLAERSGCTIVVPDLFNGQSISPTRMSAPPPVSAGKDLSWWGRIKAAFAFASNLLFDFLPFMIKQRPSLKRDLVDRLIDAVLASAKLGLAGYCYGAKPIWEALGRGHAKRVEACFVAHPSFSTPQDMVNAATRLSVAFPAKDDFFKGMDETEAGLKKREDPPSEVVFYPDTQHGFAARPTAETRPAFDQALLQAADWFKKWLH